MNNPISYHTFASSEQKCDDLFQLHAINEYCCYLECYSKMTH